MFYSNGTSSIVSGDVTWRGKKAYCRLQADSRPTDLELIMHLHATGPIRIPMLHQFSFQFLVLWARQPLTKEFGGLNVAPKELPIVFNRTSEIHSNHIRRSPQALFLWSYLVAGRLSWKPFTATYSPIMKRFCFLVRQHITLQSGTAWSPMCRGSL